VNDPLDQDLATGVTSDEEEIVDALPVPAMAGAPVAAPSRASLLPGNAVATQAATVAVSSFAAGVATVALVRHRRVIRDARRRRKARKQLGKVIGTRSFLVDIHFLGGRD
jgi:hypothetical protein